MTAPEQGDLWVCETWTAGPNTPSHVRRLTEMGPFQGGGADGPALCGREVSWDVMKFFGGDQHIFPICVKCAAALEGCKVANHPTTDGRTPA